ncbi:MAG TPA: hypothetical protein VFJ16_14080 [Longimicrobium sp.]|nr:hypothetical protein [Longimicrobium sp.]
MKKKPRRASEAPLPRSPLELAWPLHVRGPEPEGGVILAELPPADAVTVLRLLRLVLAFARGPAGIAVLRRDALESWEAEFHADPGHSLWGPAVTILAELGAGERANLQRMANGCMVVGEWLLERGAWQSSLLYFEAAALAWPHNPRLAWTTGRMLRNYGKMREAELWLRRAARIAVWNGDEETQDLALNSLGNLFAQQGCYRQALNILNRALKLATRLSMQRRGAVSHDLLLVFIGMDEHQRAEHVAAEAIRLYGPDHPNLPKLAHDIALLWTRQRKYLLALPILRALVPALRLPYERLRVLASIACAAGAAGDRAVFEQAWSDASELLDDPHAEIRYFLPEVLADLGTGAAALREWDKASNALHRALDLARDGQRHDVVARVEAVLETVAGGERLFDRMRPGSPSAAQLSSSLVRLLENLDPEKVEIGGGIT